LKGLNQYYGESRIPYGILRSMCRSGALVCLMGRNGVGKTTLAEVHHGVVADSLWATSPFKARI
jgi:ABC-type branched-subunit amino acid transport system ATPase component